MRLRNYLILITAITFGLVCSVDHTTAATAALSNLAASMQPGTWAELVQTNINSVLGQGQSEGNQIPYGFSAAWDPVRNRLHFTGSDHHDAVSATKYMYYDAASNSWTLYGAIGVTWGHGYDHNTIDPATGTLYVRDKGIDTTGNAIWSYPPGGTWSVRTRWPIGGYIQVAIGTDWWTGALNGGGSQGSLVVYNCGSAEIRIWNPQTDQWLTALNSFNGSSTYHCFIEYSSVYNVAVFGGGNLDRRKIWRLNADRTVTALPDAPVDLGVQAANMVPDPITGNFLVMGLGQFWEFDPRGGGSWRQLPAPPAAVGNPGSPNYNSVISASLSNYGVVTYVTCRASNCNMYLYKHAAGSGLTALPPPPVDATSPTVSITSPASGSTMSSTVTVSATASDNVGVAGVLFKLDGQNLGSEDTASPYSVSWNTSGAANGSHVLTAVARDTAGNQITSSSVSVSVNNVASPPPPNNVTSPPPPSDFTTRCAATGVIKCVGFDQASDIAGTYGDNSGIMPGDAIPQLDSSIKASGNSALKFTIPSNSGANSSGSYFTNFSNDLSLQFGENSDFYVQWRQRFSPEFLNTNYQGAGGWKQSIVGTGDKAGCSSSTSASGQCYASCTTLETVTQNTFQRGFPQMYNSCAGSTSHGPYNPFEQSFGTYDFKLQNARPTPYCLYSQGQTSPTSFLPPTGNCFGYFPNEWMTFQVRIKTGPRVNDEFTNSYVELWIGREGQASVQVFNWGPYNLSAGSPTENQRFGKVWLLPYDTGKSSAQTHPVGYTWYDELIISRSRIPDPIGTVAAPTTDTTPPVISNVSVSSVSSSAATFTWTTNEPADSQVDYGTTTSYGATTTRNISLVTAHSQSLVGLSPGTPYNYRVKSIDAAGNTSLSSNFTFATTAATPPPPPADTTSPTVSITSPASGSTMSSTVTVSATASDNVGVAGVLFKLDGQNLGSEDTASPYSVSWNTSGAANGSHVLTAVARDTAGNQITSSSVSVSVNNVTSPPPPPSDFTTRCAATGVIKCVGFDQASDIAGTYGDNSGIMPGDAIPQLDSSIKASGNSALKFTIPSNSGANSSGSYFTNFSNDLSLQFGENSDFYVQWRQRFSPEFLNTNYQGAGGWKQSIVGTGDKAGCSSSTSASGQCYASCTTLETVTQNTYQRGFPQMYNSCSGSTSHGPYNPFEQSFGTYDFKLQNARPTPYCLYSQGQTSPTSFLPPTGNCFGYFPNEWMTFQVRIKTGPRVNDEFTNSYVELWIGREGQASVQVFNWGPYNLSAGSPTENQRFGKVWLLPYDTGKSSAQTHPVGYTWYDELIISRSRIPDPIGTVAAPTTDTTPPVISNVSVSSVSSSAATFTWTTNEPADSQVDYGTTTSYGATTTRNISLVTAHSQSLAGLSPGTAYNYRVKSIDAAGNTSLSSNFTFATTAAIPPAPPPPPPPTSTGLGGSWKLDENGGTVAIDSSGNSSTGTLMNGTTWGPGKFGSAAKFDGVDDYIELGNPSSLQITGSMTISAWINSSAFPVDDAAVVSRRNSNSIGFQLDTTIDRGPRTIGFKLTTTSGTNMVRYGSTPLLTNTWYHIAGVYDATARTMNVYLNGQLDNGDLVGTVDSAQLSTPSDTFSIGRRTGLTGYNFAGSIDEVRIDARALSQTEIQALTGIVTTTDSILPLVSLTAPQNGTTGSGSMTVTASASDNVGVAGVQFKLDGANLGTEDTSAPYSVIWNTTAIPNGSHVLSAVARDAAGNRGSSTNVTVTVNNVLPDTTAPTVSITAPLPNTTVSGSMTLTANAFDNVGVAGVQFKLDGANLSAEDTSAPYSIVWNTTAVPNGSHVLSAVARDAAGNRGSSTNVTVTVNNVVADTTAPTVSITAPLPNTTVSGSMTLTANASDSVGVAGVQFKLDGANLGAEDTSAPYAVSWNTTAVSNGSHVLSAVARDAAGNRGSSTNATVTVNNAPPDTTAPTVSITAPLQNTTISGTAVVLSATASDNTGVVGVQFQVDGSNLGLELSSAPFSTTLNTTTMSAGQHVLTAITRDAAGNRSTSAGVTVLTNSTKYTINDKGSQQWILTGGLSSLTAGFARADRDPGTTLPAGFGVIAYREGNVLITESAVPATVPVQSGRFFVESNSLVTTGIVIANLASSDASIDFFFTDSTGLDFGRGKLVVKANNRLSALVTDPPLNGRKSMQGTFTFNSSIPVAVVALRNFINESGKSLMSAIPVEALPNLRSGPTTVPYFANGAGWNTQLILVNRTDSVLTGTIQFFGQGTTGQSTKPLRININDTNASLFTYQLSPRGTATFLSSGRRNRVIQIGSIQITPAANSVAPAALAILTSKNDSITTAMATIPSSPAGNAFRASVESSGTNGAPGSVQAGVAIANPTNAATKVAFELYNPDGTSAQLSTTVDIPAGGQILKFMSDLFPQLPASFNGNLRVTANSSVVVTGLRRRYNERSELLMTAIVPSTEAVPATSSQLTYPFILGGQGYSTKFILYSGSPGTSSGELDFLAPDGTLMGPLQSQ